MIKIGPLFKQHAAEVLQIYHQGILTGIATFETTVPSWDVFDKKYLPHSRLVAISNDDVIGWTALSPVSTRECYKGVAEVSIYIHPFFRSRGVGQSLLNALVYESENNGIWSLLSVMHQENIASIRLHENSGFRTIGYRERIAKQNDVWKTTIMMERRSDITGL